MMNNAESVPDENNFTTDIAFLNYNYSEEVTMLGTEATTVNATELPEMPIDMRFNDGHLILIIVYR